METKKNQVRWLYIFMFTNMQKHFKPKILPCNGMQNQTQHRKKKGRQQRMQKVTGNQMK